jgi:peptidoglycan/LPS O-acetylase OafA/YrhL
VALAVCLFQDQAQRYLVPLLMLLAYMSAFRGRLLNQAFRYSWIAAIGGMCYTIYLYHNWCMALLDNLRPHLYRGEHFALRFVIDGVVFAVGTLVICALVFVFLEKPFMRKDWPQRWGRALANLFRRPSEIIVVARAIPEPVEAIETEEQKTGR